MNSPKTPEQKEDIEWNQFCEEQFRKLTPMPGFNIINIS